MNTELIKEKIAWYKLLFTVLVTVSAGSIGWFVANFSKSLRFFIVIDAIFITIFLIGIIFCILKVRFYFKKLGEKSNV